MVGGKSSSCEISHEPHPKLDVGSLQILRRRLAFGMQPEPWPLSTQTSRPSRRLVLMNRWKPGEFASTFLKIRCTSLFHVSFPIFSPRADWIPWLKRGFLWMHLPNFMAIAAMSSRLESLGKFTEEFLRTKRFWFDHFDPSPCFFSSWLPHVTTTLDGRNPASPWMVQTFKPYK